MLDNDFLVIMISKVIFLYIELIKTLSSTLITTLSIIITNRLIITLIITSLKLIRLT